MEQQIEDILESSTTLSHSGREWPLGTGRDEGRDSGGSGERTSTPGSCLVPGLSHFSV